MDLEWNRKYTQEALVEEWALLERHYRDGSYQECTCMPEKHLPTISGLASEMVMFSLSDQEKEFYSNMADVARKFRQSIEDGDHKYFPHNPQRAYLPHGLTTLEHSSATLRHKLSRCIKAIEASSCPAGFKNYGECSVNPVAACRASIE